jgi:hypothetical protein
VSSDGTCGTPHLRQIGILGMLKTCPQCQETFKTYFSKARFCSKPCHNASMMDRPTFECANCHKEFQRPRHVIKKETILKFCCQPCQSEYRLKNAAPAIPCEVCGTMFKHANSKVRHCSWDCRNKGLVTATESKCEWCGKNYRAFACEAKHGRRFCSHACAERASRGAEHPNYKGGACLEFGTHWRRVRLAIRERDKVCRLCGGLSRNGRSLDVHHINERRGHLFKDVANDAKNLVALCRPCHLRTENAIRHGRTSLLPKWLRPLGLK